jgi:hypothetical protein
VAVCVRACGWVGVRVSGCVLLCVLCVCGCVWLGVCVFVVCGCVWLCVPLCERGCVRKCGVCVGVCGLCGCVL